VTADMSHGMRLTCSMARATFTHHHAPHCNLAPRAKLCVDRPGRKRGGGEGAQSARRGREINFLGTERWPG